jgi:L-lactate dehydrogenase complex protein LldF
MRVVTTAHPVEAARFIANEERTHWHDTALWFVRAKRDKAAHSVPEWEALRQLASQIKTHTLSRLADYLEQFEANATRLGAEVHWARNDQEHNQIVLDILQRHGAQRVVKSKSMLTEECHLNPFLEQHGIEVVDTDLGERIVQLRREPPSHIVLPAIHIKKEEVGALFHQQLGTPAAETDPQRLAEAARAHLREKFMRADAGLTGVNFAVAETGGLVVCTNEGNADLGVSLPRLHIASLGIEKLIPRAQDLGVFLRLLARSATGQPITTYTSHFHGPLPGGELHIVLVDNGRTQFRRDAEFRPALHCIRCGACLNTCPVYRRSGGYSYHHIIPGPIGSVLGPLREAKQNYSLPYACSLCGSCSDVCPVRIPLHDLLLAWRGRIAARKLLPWHKRTAMKVARIVLGSTWLFTTAGKLGRWIVPWLPRWLIYNPLNAWGKHREIPEFPRKSFRELYRERHGKPQ